MFARFLQKLPMSLVILAGMVGLLIALQGWQEALALREYEQAMSEVEVIVPQEQPPQDQESIDTAMVLFSIKTPPTVDGPTFDYSLGDRGLTTGGLVLPQKRVTVGPAAFTSWSVLGSTLAHEIEVHVPQSFFMVVAEDHITRWQIESRRIIGRAFPRFAPSAKELFENDGTWKAERDAYMHEIKNAKRFGLSQEELASIWRVMDYFYPAAQNDKNDPQLSASSENEKELLNREDVRPLEL